MPVDAGETIRAATESDIPRIASLFEEVFRETRDERMWRWKYFHPSRRSLSVVCEVKGRLVAHCGGVDVEFVDRDRRYGAYQLVDFMSSRAYAGGIGAGGVFIRTADWFFRRARALGVKWVYGFPGERHRLVGQQLLGYPSLEPVGEWTLQPRDGRRKIAPLSKDFLRRFAPPVAVFGATRDPEYLEWRYLLHPMHTYGAVEVARWFGRRTVAAAIVRERGDTIDLMEVGGSFAESAVARLVSKLARLGRPVRFWCSLKHPFARQLSRLGFQGNESSDHMIGGRWFRPEGTDQGARGFFTGQTPRPEEFYYTLGDYDVF